jgi:hypothetical protein
MTKFSGNLADLAPRSARDDRAKAEAETVAKVDGRKLRRKNRTEQMAFRFTPERRAQLEKLSLATGLSFVDLVERGLDLIEEQERRKQSR